MFRKRGLILLCVVAMAAAIACASPDKDVPNINDFAITGLKDLEARVKVDKADQNELTKINRDFGMAYRLKDINLKYKEPGMLRMEGAIGSMVLNGSTRLFRVPQIKLSKKDELGDEPGRKYSLLDVGILTKESISPYTSKFVRSEIVDGAKVHVFELTFLSKHVVQYIIWVNPVNSLIVKRDWLDLAGKKKATFYYRDPKEIGARIWVPTRIDIMNSENTLAGSTIYSEVKVNQGLDVALFQIP